jgi:hypothetical protein
MVSDDGAAGSAADQSDAPAVDRSTSPPSSSDVDHEFGRQGWVLVGLITVAFLIIPGLLYALPAARGTVASLGLGWHHTYFALPMIPAVLLGAVAVWSAVRSRSA